MTELLLGDEAVAVAALDAGIAGAFSYPGTPATEILECVRDRTGSGRWVSAVWSANEKVAYEEALCVSFLGRRALVSMKHVGLNVAADPFMSSALTGALGGLVVAVADDPGMHSSQNEQDTRFYADFARLPLFEPCDPQEAYDMTREAFEGSERLGIPILIRLVTRLSHSRGVVHRSPPVVGMADPLRRGESADWTLLPPNARRRFRRLIDLQWTLQDESHRSRFNHLVLRGPKGIIACGTAHNYVVEAVGDDSPYSVLKLGAYPVPVEMVRQFMDHCEQVLVVEEGYPFLETKLTGLLGLPGKRIEGRCTAALPPDGELTVDLVRAALQLPVLDGRPLHRDLPPRPPQLCEGCPHCDSFRVLTEAVGKDAQPYYFGDIGCYTLGYYPPFNAVHTCVDMGASIAMALGAARAGAHPVIATIGDSTFTHSAMPALLQAAAEDAPMTVVIMDNASVAMTGGQKGLVTGDALIRLLRGLGVDARHIVGIEPVEKEHDKNVGLVRAEIEHRGLSVILACRPCIHWKRRAGSVGRLETSTASA